MRWHTESCAGCECRYACDVACVCCAQDVRVLLSGSNKIVESVKVRFMEPRVGGKMRATDCARCTREEDTECVAAVGFTSVIRARCFGIRGMRDTTECGSMRGWQRKRTACAVMHM